MAIDGLHTATIEADQTVALRMHDVTDFSCEKDHTFLDTGSPHHVAMVEDLAHFPVVEKGRSIRRGAPYFEAGSNVNFVEKVNENTFAIRTYERGVEDETLSCGTGATAVALAMFQKRIAKKGIIKINTKGGELLVNFKNDNKKFNEIYLIGPADHIFSGKIKI